MRCKSILLAGAYPFFATAPFMLALPAQAQTTSESSKVPTSSEPGSAADIVVTGSRVARSGFEQPTPTTVIGQDFLNHTAATNVADALNTLPQLRASLTPSANTASVAYAGKNMLDLRGLGAQRTLVLVDGQRFVSGIVEGPVDLNAIPQAMIDSTDVVTGGASAAYGSDAVAGVVNLRLLKTFEGFKGTLQGGITDHDDYRNFLASVAWGTSFADGRGHLVLSGEAAQNSGVTDINNRSWSAAQPGQISNPAYTATNGQPASLLVSSGALSSNTSYGGVINSGPLKGVQFGPGGTPLPFNYGTLTTSTTQRGGDGAYTYRNWYLSAPSQRYVGYGRLSFDASDALKLTGDLSYADTEATAVSSTRSDTAITIQADNAFLPASIRNAMATDGVSAFTMGRFSSDYGNVHVPSVTKTWRGSLAASGSIGGGWSYDAYYTHGDTRSTQSPKGVRITANYAYAVDAVTDPTTGAAVCRNAAARASGCVPINLFGDGSPSSQALAYITANSFRTAHMIQDAAEATLRGTPLSTWAGPVSVAFGGGYRHESTSFNVSALQQQFALATGNGTPWRGAVSVKEGFGEVVAPLLKDVRFARALDLDVAGRVTNYSTSGTVETWKAGVNWAVDDHLRFRGTISRDIKAPSLSDQFSAGITNLLSVYDPQLNQTYQIRTLTVGTTNLKPEAATTKTIGVVMQNVVPRLRASVDYYDISIANAIGTLAAGDIVLRCSQGQSNLCSLITRGSGGAITNVNIVPLNLQTVRERGLDIQADYAFPLGAGKVSLSANANYVAELSYRDGVSTVRLDGSVYTPFTVGANGVPHWRGMASVNYAIGPFNLYTAARFTGAARINNSLTSKDLNILNVPSRTYVDLSGSYKLVSYGKRKLELFAKVTNLFDKDPPLTNGYFGTETTLYDVIGRTYAAGVRFAF